MLVTDTDIIIWILRNDSKTIKRFEELVAQTNCELYITPIQVAEIYSGLKPKEIKRTSDLLDCFNLININLEIGILAGTYMNKYGKSHALKMADALIGAAAKVNGFKLWTLNHKHYPMFKSNELIIRNI
ncbi:MAG: type II toxin-antitoxin system VapC family toxin [Candidatus Dadabacteria bacterium]|nr:type II toxin-antitoxin system VapC family toxin [Candidatus Dadabacteria bacterium]